MNRKWLRSLPPFLSQALNHVRAKYLRSSKPLKSGYFPREKNSIENFQNTLFAKLLWNRSNSQHVPVLHHQHQHELEHGQGWLDHMVGLVSSCTEPPFCKAFLARVDTGHQGVSQNTKYLRSLSSFGTYIYGSVSAGRGKWLFRVIFFQKIERSCD